jgi:hypothetical protein
MKKILTGTEKINYGSKLHEAYSIFANQKQGIIAYKRR